MKYLIIGAGPCGLAAARALKDAGILYDQVETAADLGGNWLHGVYHTVYTDACKDVMQFPEYPMPADYPDFLSQPQMLAYLQDYARHFDLRRNIRFRTKVRSVEPGDENTWIVFFEAGDYELYAGVIICNGHHWDRNIPLLPGRFSGEYIHAKDYKEPAQLQGKRVLVIGSGNSAADIACEAARVGRDAVISMRDSPWIFPKSFMGIPLGRMKLKNAPKFLDPLLIRLLIKISFGKHAHYHLPEPRHRPFEKHPTVSEELPYYLKHGRIIPKPAIAHTDGKTVWFEDNSSVQADLIVAATGYHLSFPFLPPALVRTDGKNLQCLGYCVYPDYKGLFFMGWQQARGGVGSLASAFAKVIADLIRIEEQIQRPAGEVLARMGNRLSETHLYGGKDIVRWVARHPYEKMLRYSRKLVKLPKHLNR
jgi:hypothetical protein